MKLNKTLATMLVDAINVCILGDSQDLDSVIPIEEQQKELCNFLNLIKVHFPKVAETYEELWWSVELGDNKLL